MIIIPPNQLDQKFLSEEHLKYFKEQLLEVMQLVRDNPQAALAIKSKKDDDLECDGEMKSSGTEAESAETDAQPPTPTPTQQTAETQTTNQQPLQQSVAKEPIEVSPPKATAGQQEGRQPPPMPKGGSAASIATEHSSDAEFYYTPVGSPDESRRSSVISVNNHQVVRFRRDLRFGLIYSLSILFQC